MRIVMAGASGFLGTRLRGRLADAGHDIVTLVRRRAASPHERSWAPDRRELDPTVLADADAVINLAGAGVGDRRWTPAYKAEIRSSRINPTATIATAIASPTGQRAPAVLVNASAVGFYGDTGDTIVDERSPAGRGFFPDVCQAWEAATGPAEDAGIRVVKLRTGLVLDAGGGLLKPMLVPFRLFVGGRLGTGRQWMPWIAADDWLDAVEFLLARGDIGGPVNLVGPHPARNADLSKALGRVLHRPAILAVPTFALHIALGEFGREAVASQRVLPRGLSRAGFAFHHPDLDSALRAAIHR